MSFFDIFTTPPTIVKTKLGDNLSGPTTISSSSVAHDGVLDRIWDALPFGTLVKRVPSVNTAAKGVAIGAVEAGKGVGSAAAAAGQAAVSGISKAVMILVLIAVAWFLLPSLVSGAVARR